MAAFGQLILTDLGIQAQIKAQSGGTSLKFTRIGVGSGEFSGDIKSLTNLVKEEVSVGIEKAYIQDYVYVVEGTLTNEDLPTSFIWREIGLYIEDENGNDVLYSYANAGKNYDTVPEITDERCTKNIRIATAVSSSYKVAIVQKPSNIANNLETTDEGYVLDARQGKVLNDRIINLSIDLTVERARINNLSTLKEGSTTGDAELIDARLDKDGNVHENVGKHIRSVSTQLSNEIDEQAANTEKIIIISPNLFNVESSMIKNDVYIKENGVFSEDGVYISHPIYVRKGVKYKYPFEYSSFGVNNRYASCNPDTGEIISVYNGSLSDDNLYSIITPETNMWIMVNIGKDIETFMFCELEKYPSKYWQFGDISLTSDMVIAIGEELSKILPLITPEMTTFINQVQSENMFNKNDVIYGTYYDTATGEIKEYSTAFRCLIPVTSGGYAFAGSTSLFGTGSSLTRIPLFDKDEKFVRYVTGEMGEVPASYTRIVTYTISDEDISDGVVYAGYSGSIYMIDTAMYVRGNVYPTKYIAYDEYLEIPKLRISEDTTNPLYGKKAVFDGDSICSGASAEDNLSGWAGRIGVNNNMTWENFGVGGGTITTGLYYSDGSARHWLSHNIETIHANYPELDYLILEGGTNDADLLDENTQIGNFDLGDFGGVYDNATFCGALETLFYKAVTYYPHTKIGFIVAQRMGDNPTNYDITGNKRYRYFVKAMEICKKWGIPYINLWDTSHMNPKIASMYNQSLDAAGNRNGGYLYTDGQHLTSAGYDRITPMIEAWLKTL